MVPAARCPRGRQVQARALLRPLARDAHLPPSPRSPKLPPRPPASCSCTAPPAAATHGRLQVRVADPMHASALSQRPRHMLHVDSSEGPSRVGTLTSHLTAHCRVSPPQPLSTPRARTVFVNTTLRPEHVVNCSRLESGHRSSSIARSDSARARSMHMLSARAGACDPLVPLAASRLRSLEGVDEAQCF